jgi:cyanophycinase-like exopeptidase
VLSLLDQIYDLRGRMNALLTAVAAQPPDVRTAVLDAIRQR